ncbi:MAG TPA: CBS domain-containing protein, partial [Roseiflexaceae bacterium]|nr:CBS domain-containing protein [Roseiflexaceae bacterium]
FPECADFFSLARRGAAYTDANARVSVEQAVGFSRHGRLASCYRHHAAGEVRKAIMHVHDHMRSAPVTISADANLQSALRVLQERAVRRLPVTDDGGRIVGIVTERDLLLAASHYVAAPIEVDSIMRRSVVTATPEMPLADAAMLMVEHKIGGLPVLDAEQRLVGIITESDIFRAFVALLSKPDTTFEQGAPACQV